MPFEEALERYLSVDPRELSTRVARLKRKKAAAKRTKARKKVKDRTRRGRKSAKSRTKAK